MTMVSRDEIFLLFALQECASGIRALDEATRLSRNRNEIEAGVVRFEHDSILAAIRQALHYAGSVTRIFWPPRNIARGEHLRAFVGLAAEHRLSSRSLRDSIEHLDERIDRWTDKDPRYFLNVQSVIHDFMNEKTRSSISEGSLWFYDARSNSVNLMGDVYDLNKLRSDLIDVRDHLSEAIVRIYEELDNPEKN